MTVTQFVGVTVRLRAGSHHPPPTYLRTKHSGTGAAGSGTAV